MGTSFCCSPTVIFGYMTTGSIHSLPAGCVVPLPFCSVFFSWSPGFSTASYLKVHVKSHHGSPLLPRTAQAHGAFPALHGEPQMHSGAPYHTGRQCTVEGKQPPTPFRSILPPSIGYVSSCFVLIIICSAACGENLLHLFLKPGKNTSIHKHAHKAYRHSCLCLRSEANAKGSIPSVPPSANSRDNVFRSTICTAG